MPLFGPNVKRMKERGDVQGLLSELRNKNTQVRAEVVKALTEIKHVEGLSDATKNDSREIRVQATEALGELRNIDALAQAFLKSDKPEVRYTSAQALKNIGGKDAIEALMRQLSSIMRLGNSHDQIEAMIVMQGRFPPGFVEEQLVAEHHEISQNVQEPIELHWVQGLLDELIEEDKDPHSRWFALLTLVELGDRRDEVLQELIKHSVSYTKACDERLEERAGRRDFALYMVANETNRLIEETMRALAAFKSNATATQIVIEILEGDLLRGSYVHGNRSSRYLHPKHKENAICALGALGGPVALERLEYLASRETGAVRTWAGVALANLGKATYDEIKARAEPT